MSKKLTLDTIQKRRELYQKSKVIVSKYEALLHALSNDSTVHQFCKNELGLLGVSDDDLQVVKEYINRKQQDALNKYEALKRELEVLQQKANSHQIF